MAYSMTELLAETEEKYGDFEMLVPVRDKKTGNEKVDETGEPVIETARFRFYLRVDREARQRLAQAYKYATGEEEMEKTESGEAPGDGMDMLVEYLKQTVRSLSVAKRDYELVADWFGDDLMYWSFFIEKYSENFGGIGDSGE